jgi:cysteine desulfurase / selenocysteine lyase
MAAKRAGGQGRGTPRGRPGFVLSIKEIRYSMLTSDEVPVTTVQNTTSSSFGARTVADIRKDFPILSRQVHGKPLVYLDSTASSQKPLAVIDAMSTYYKTTHANVHRGVYELSEEATARMERSRVKVARFINARQSKQVIFTRNTTESINLVAYSWGYANIHAGDLIILTELEHHSNLVPWQLLAQHTNARLEFIPVTDDGLLRLDVYEELLRQEPKLVAFAHMSNVLGTINPVQKMIALAHAAGATVLIDAAQSVPHLPVDVQALDADFVCFSGHKMLGPTGIGILYGKRDILEAMPPFMGGGDMIRTVRLRQSTWNDLPWKFEAGTPAIAEAIGLGAAVDYLNSLGMQNVFRHEQEITHYAIEQLQNVPGLTIYGPHAAQRGGVVSFTLGDIHPHDLASILDQEVGVAIRAGHHCAQPLMERFGLAATARASFYVYTIPEDIDMLVQGLHKALQIFNL